MDTRHLLVYSKLHTKLGRVIAGYLDVSRDILVRALEHLDRLLWNTVFRLLPNERVKGSYKSIMVMRRGS